MLTLYIRDETTKKTSAIVYADHKGFIKHGNPTTYRAAVQLGAAAAGYGNFYVETGKYSPSREEQLLLEPKPHRGRRSSAARDAALLLD